MFFAGCCFNHKATKRSECKTKSEPHIGRAQNSERSNLRTVFSSRHGLSTPSVFLTLVFFCLFFFFSFVTGNNLTTWGYSPCYLCYLSNFNTYTVNVWTSIYILRMEGIGTPTFFGLFERRPKSDRGFGGWMENSIVVVLIM